MNEEEFGSDSLDFDVSMAVMPYVGKTIAKATLTTGGVLAAGTTAATSGIPVVTAIGTGVATTASAAITGASAVASAAGMTSIASGIASVGAASTAVGAVAGAAIASAAALAAPVLVPLAIIAGMAKLFSDE